MQPYQKSWIRWMAPAVLFVALSGCSDNPGTWSQEQVEAKIQQSLEVTQVTLTPRPEGGYTGTGKRADGETLSFTITQDPAAKRLSWDAEGDRGFFEEGSYELQ